MEKYAAWLERVIQDIVDVQPIEYIRCLEHNYSVAVAFNENQARYIESLDVAPVVHGRWLKASHPMNAQCDQCGKFAVNFAKEHLPYYPYCGTKMDGGD